MGCSCTYTVTVARRLADEINKIHTHGFKFYPSGKGAWQITVKMYGFGAPILHEFKTRKAQVIYLENVLGGCS